LFAVVADITISPAGSRSLIGVSRIMVALVNTLVMATVGRRGALFLLRRVGAMTRQLLSMTTWQTVILDLTQLILGVAAGAASVIVVSKQLAGTRCCTRHGRRWPSSAPPWQG
jgi:ABC-type lipoprotein release transport system permease subunit